MYNKKAQIGTTMNWFVATIIIIVILLISISFSEISKSSRGFSYDEQPIGPTYALKLEKGIDLLATKSLINFLLINNNFQELQKREISSKDEKIINNITQIYLKAYDCSKTTLFCNIKIKKDLKLLIDTSISGEEYIKIPLNKKEDIYFILHKSYL